MPPLNKQHILTLQEILIRLPLHRRKRTKDNFVRLLGQLVGYQSFRAS